LLLTLLHSTGSRTSLSPQGHFSLADFRKTTKGAIDDVCIPYIDSCLDGHYSDEDLDAAEANEDLILLSAERLRQLGWRTQISQPYAPGHFILFAEKNGRKFVALAAAGIRDSLTAENYRELRMAATASGADRVLLFVNREKLHDVLATAVETVKKEGHNIEVLQATMLRELGASSAPVEQLSEPQVFGENGNPIDYEVDCADALDKSGWSTRLTKSSGDQGADIIAEYRGHRVVIQCKFYSSSIGNRAVQEAVAAAAIYGAEHACVVSNQTFTRAAIQLAAANNVKLLHHEALPRLAAMLRLDT